MFFTLEEMFFAVLPRVLRGILQWRLPRRWRTSWRSWKYLGFGPGKRGFFRSVTWITRWFFKERSHLGSCWGPTKFFRHLPTWRISPVFVKINKINHNRKLETWREHSLDSFVNLFRNSSWLWSMGISGCTLSLAIWIVGIFPEI